MMAAIAAAGAGAAVTVYERGDRPGRKLFITGKGRCNVTTSVPAEDFFEHISCNPRFLYSAFYGFDNQAVQAFFESHGCPLKREHGERVFPVSDHSSDVIRTLTAEMERLGVRVRFGSRVAGVFIETSPGETEDMPHRCVRGVRLADGHVEAADAVVVCTGGASYPATGSTGDGYRFAEEAGLSVTGRSPALVPMEIAEDWCAELQGLPLRNVTLRLDVVPEPGQKQRKKRRPLYEGFGEMLFTHFGVSGPLVLSASCACTPFGQPLALTLDLKPALTPEQLDARILRDLEERHNKNFKNTLDALLPAKMIPVIVRLSGIDPQKRAAEVTREERRALVDLLKGLRLTVTGLRGFEEAIITRGGVDVRGIDPSTMQAKGTEGLFFAGEVLDVDAVTGGFNLQIAWSTGHLAGISAAGR
ncbi:MAG: NAD(P)/FAD-dependent oxidoreductase [Butyrivibrio sp.]|nr:NAD(P)/FAD-dependent oxidoreductase [Butyrivibrio sp.]